MLRNLVFKNRFLIRQVRHQATKNSPKPAKEQKSLKFQYFVALGIFSYFLLSETVKKLDGNRPKNNFTEEEYKKIQNGLKRKVKLFSDDTVNVLLIPAENIQITDTDANTQVLDLSQLVQQQKLDPDSKYGALLKECETFKTKVPVGTYTSILRDKLSSLESPIKKLIVVGFPDSVSESIKFQDKILAVDQIVNTTQSQSDLISYFETVDKVKQITPRKNTIKVADICT